MRSLKLGFMVLSAVWLSFACGNAKQSDDGGDATNSAGGGSVSAGGAAAGAAAASAGAQNLPPPVACGLQSCKAIALGGTVVAPCCADAAKGICGADLSALAPTMGCQPLTQAGALDASCPSFSGSVGGGPALPPAPGCCRAASQQCGYWIGNLGGLLPFTPGCVDPRTLGGAAAARACGSAENDGDAGGEGGAANDANTAGRSAGGTGGRGGEAGEEGGVAGTSLADDSAAGAESGSAGAAGATVP